MDSSINQLDSLDISLKSEHLSFLRYLQDQIDLPNTTATLAFVLDSILLPLEQSYNEPKARNKISAIIGPLICSAYADWAEKKKSKRERTAQYRAKESKIENDPIKKINEELGIDPNEDEFTHLGFELLPYKGSSTAHGLHEEIYKNGPGYRARVIDPSTNRPKFLTTYKTSKQAAVSRFNFFRENNLPFTLWEQCVWQTRAHAKNDIYQQEIVDYCGEGLIYYLTWSDIMSPLNATPPISFRSVPKEPEQSWLDANDKQKTFVSNLNGNKPVLVEAEIDPGKLPTEKQLKAREKIANKFRKLGLT